jgi:hypothetical protein
MQGGRLRTTPAETSWRGAMAETKKAAAIGVNHVALEVGDIAQA